MAQQYTYINIMNPPDIASEDDGDLVSGILYDVGEADEMENQNIQYCTWNIDEDFTLHIHWDDPVLSASDKAILDDIVSDNT